MRPSETDRLYLEEITASRYPVAADDLNAMATQMAAGTEPEGATPMSLAEAATSAADVPAGLLKGVVQGSIGLPGDIISLVRGVYDLGRSGGDVDAFLGGLEKATGLPTTEDVKKFFDETLGIPLVPAGASERRREAAKIPEFVGELGGAGKTAIEGTKAAVRGINVGAMAVADKAVQAITGNPQATAIEVIEETSRPFVRAITPTPMKLSNKKIGEAFNRLVNTAKDDFEEVMSNWQSGVFLNDDKDKLITYPGRDQAFSRGKEGGKVNVTKKEMIEWLMSDGPFDEKIYGPDIRNDKQWVAQIERLRSTIKGEQ